MRAGPGAIAMALVLGACSAAGSDGGAPTTTSGSIPAARSACEAIADLDDVASVVAEYETADGLTQALTAAEAVFAAAQAEHDTAIGAAQDARDHRRLAVDAATVARQALTSTGNFPIVLAYRTGTVSEELGRVPTEADIARIEDEGERLQAAVDQAEQEEDEARRRRAATTTTTQRT